MRPSFLLLAVLLSGCAAAEHMKQAQEFEAEINMMPTNYKADIVTAMRTYLNDPTNVRDAYVSEPTLKTLDGITRYTSCLRYNAKKSGGQYAGSKDSVITFRSGRLDRIIDSAREQCKDAAYQRFPELERMVR
jgi:hypothetical protein